MPSFKNFSLYVLSQLVKNQDEFAKQLSHNIWPAKRAYVSYIALLAERRKFATAVGTTLSGTGVEEA